jgi:hypothetical protein
MSMSSMVDKRVGFELWDTFKYPSQPQWTFDSTLKLSHILVHVVNYWNVGGWKKKMFIG